MAPATEQMVFDVLIELFKVGIARYEAVKNGATTAGDAHAQLSSILATISGATAGSDQMADVAEEAKFASTGSPEGGA